MATNFISGSIEGCKGNAHSSAYGYRGWCGAHYQRWQRHGDPLGGRNHIRQKIVSGSVCSVDGCDKPIRARGWCSTHYRRWSDHGDPLGGRKTFNGEPQQFYRDVVLKHDSDECLIWPYLRNSAGYGRVTSEDGRQAYVHRLVCEEVNGPPPMPKHDAAHSCGKGHLGCCAKRHLSWKTRAENFADKLTHGTHKRGERQWNTKLTEGDVRKIRSLIGTISQTRIAEMFGVSQGTISDINNGRKWAWLDAD